MAEDAEITRQRVAVLARGEPGRTPRLVPQPENPLLACPGRTAGHPRVILASEDDATG